MYVKYEVYSSVLNQMVEPDSHTLQLFNDLFGTVFYPVAMIQYLFAGL